LPRSLFDNHQSGILHCDDLFIGSRQSIRDGLACFEAGQAEK
jgi:hypothetical protein